MIFYSFADLIDFLIKIKSCYKRHKYLKYFDYLVDLGTTFSKFYFVDFSRSPEIFPSKVN